MKHQLSAGRAIALAAAALAMVLVAACGGSSDPTPQPEQSTATPTDKANATSQPTTVATPDVPEPIVLSSSGGTAAAGGALSLSIPPSALPAGVSLSDVTIESIGADDLAVSIEDADVVAAYRLLPDGLVLSEPATVSMQVPATGLSGNLLLIHLTEEGLSPIDDLTVTIDDAGEVATLEATIRHFSDLTAMQARFFDVGLSLTKNVYKVGESFPVTVVVSSTGKGWGIRELEQGIVTVKVADPIILFGFWTGKAPSLLPDLVDERPSISGLEGSYTNTQVFTCAEEAHGVSVVYRGTLGYFLEQQFLGDDGSQAARDIPGGGGEIALFEQEPIDCVTVPPIVAFQSAPTTTYSIDVDADAGFRFSWSGPDCGSSSGTGTRAMVWEHGDEDCEHAGEDHPDTEISVLVVSADGSEWRCNYKSAASGTGELCEKLD